MIPLRLRTVLRTSPGAWLAIPLLVLSCALAAGFAPAASDAYAVAYTATGLIALVLAAPVCAATAAWEGGRLRRAGVWAGPIVRRRPRVALGSVLPSAVAGCVAVIAASELHLLAGGMVLPDMRLVALAVLVVVAHSTAGFAAGLVLPTAVALPGAMLASFAWMALPAAVEPLWLRHLNGALATCCMLGDELSVQALAAAALVAGGVVVAGLLIASAARPGAAHWLSATVVLAAVTVSGSWLVASLGPDPATRRDEAQLVCAHRAPDIRVCVWPEHASRLAEVADLAASVVAAWRSAGLPVASAFSETSVPGTHAAFGFANASTRDDLVASMAYAQLPGWPACADAEPYLAVGVLDDLQAWYALVGGLDEGEIGLRFAAPAGPGDEPAAQVARALRGVPADVAADWTRRNLAAAATCSVAPSGLPTP